MKRETYREACFTAKSLVSHLQGDMMQGFLSRAAAPDIRASASNAPDGSALREGKREDVSLSRCCLSAASSSKIDPRDANGVASVFRLRSRAARVLAHVRAAGVAAHESHVRTPGVERRLPPPFAGGKIT